MKREIKFRAWDVDRKVMCTDLLRDYSGSLRKAMKLEPHEYLKMLAGDFKDYQVMQFTGLTDKNGREVYEGDILKIGLQAHPVIWDDKGAHGWVLDTPHFSLGGSQSIFYEIVGNIYENPELL